MNADVKKSAFNVARNLVIVVKFYFYVFKKLSKITDKPASEVARSHSSFTLSFDLIAQRQNKRFFRHRNRLAAWVCRLYFSGGEKR